MTPDPYRASAGPVDPGSWNRYAYVQGDPVNFYDPAGLKAEFPGEAIDGGGAYWGGFGPYSFYSYIPEYVGWHTFYGPVAFAMPGGGGATITTGPQPLTPAQAMAEGLRRLRAGWKHCLDLFSNQDASDFDFNDFTRTAKGITWVDTRGKGGERVIEVDGDYKALAEYVGDAYATVLPGTGNRNLSSKVAVGRTWFAELDSDARAANAIHEALHVYFDTYDPQLKTWLSKLGFTPNATDTHDITSWIKGGCR